jgi:hypothetical protein
VLQTRLIDSGRKLYLYNSAENWYKPYWFYVVNSAPSLLHPPENNHRLARLVEEKNGSLPYGGVAVVKRPQATAE